jgi:prepilin-type N-terminal cleavage/methylation domain-containing protein/prepilin-type processing-associated H-X9-DG protein
VNRVAAKRAFSLIELLTVISIIAVLAALLLTSLASAKRKSRQAACINNLHQIGLAFTGFALEHEGKFQMDVPERLGGSMEFNSNLLIEKTPFSRDFHHFAVLSNELPNVKVMACPADRPRRRPAANYHSFTNENLSYWANTKAQPHSTLSTLAGDWNVYNAGGSNDFEQINFGREVHQRRGSVLFADGRVEITRTLAIATPVTSDPFVAASAPGTPQPQPPTTAGAPEARPQPASATPPPAVQSTSTTGPTASNNGSPRPRDKKPEIAPNSSTNEVTATTASSDVQFGSRRIGRGGSGNGSDASPPKVRHTEPYPISGAGGPSSGAEEEDPWNTSSFRLFKTLAFLSYLISLLWALVALLLLYLKARLAQREEEEREAAVNVD